MSFKWKKECLVLLIFVVISVIMTYPVVFKMTKGWVVSQFQDDLITIWTLSWDIHKISHLDFSHFFDANVFYPYRLTLTSAEHMIFTAIMALPIYWLVRDMIVVYGILDILSFGLTAFTMFLFVRYLTKSNLAGFVAGVLFSFLPYKFYYIHQQQNLMTMWIPLIFLYLHRFYEDMKYRYILYAALFYVFTSLSNGYYMLFLIPFLVLFVLFYAVKRGVLFTAIHTKGMLLFLVVSAVFIVPFYYPYFEVSRLFGEKRSIMEVSWYSASLASYYSAYSWYSRFRFFHFLGDRPLFIGFLPIFLVGYLFARLKDWLNEYANIIFYALFSILAIFLSFGPFINRNPHLLNIYFLLYKYFPGFYGVREPSRFAVFASFGVAILAGYGISLLYKKTQFKRVLWVIPFLILIEYASFPLHMVRVPNDGRPLKLCRWLANQRGEFAIFETPYNINEIPFYMYFSIFHWKRQVSSFNTYLPPIQEVLELSDLDRQFSIAEEMDVRYMIVYKRWFPAGNWERFLRAHRDRLRLVYEDDWVYVCELTRRNRDFVPYGDRVSRHEFDVYIPGRLPPGGETLLVLRYMGKEPFVVVDRYRVGLVWYDGAGRERSREDVVINGQRLGYVKPGWSLVGRFRVPDLEKGRYKVVIVDGDKEVGSLWVLVSSDVRYWRCQRLPEDGYKVRYVKVEFPEVLEAGSKVTCDVRLENLSRYTWITYDNNRWQMLYSSKICTIDTRNHIHLSYHWKDMSGRYVVFDGNRVALPCVVRPGKEISVKLPVNTPHKTGKYCLEIDLVQEGVSWFSKKGASVCRKEVLVQ